MARGDRFPGTRPTMPAVDLHGRDGFALLARAFVELGAKEHLPALPAAGARDVASALAAASALVQTGVPAEVLVNLATWYRDHAGSGSSTDGPGSVALVISSTPARPAGSGEATVPQPATAGQLAVATVPRDSGPPPDPVPANPGRRGDIPVRREVRRACKRSALEAALEEHRRDALADLDENVLARSSQAPFQSRVRTWVDLCQAWAVEPWPISLEAIRNVAASLRRGGYRSAQNYFDAAVTYQERFREQAVDPLLKKAMRRYTRAVLRTLPGSRLKAVFTVDRLAALLTTRDAPAARAWSPWTSAHAADALLLAAWFMLREIEFAAARTQDLEAAGGTVTLRVPLHKSATGGQTELTMRQLRCACRAAVAPLCPYHAAVRHMDRLKTAGLWFRDRPLFPDSTGDTWEKSSAILLFRRVLVAAGIQTTSVDHTGAPIQLFGGHLARVAGASWLASKGVPTPVIQLLGRWSSAAVERYIQAAPLAMAPDVPQRVLHQPAGLPPPALEFGSVVARPPAAQSRPPAIMDADEPEDTGAPPLAPSPVEFSPAVDFVPEPTPDPAALSAATGTAPERYIYNAKALRVHAADPAEASSDRFLWKTKGCSWPYGVRAFYRITEKPADAAWCLRCFPQFRDRPAPGSPTEVAESPVASSSDSTGSSESSD